MCETVRLVPIRFWRVGHGQYLGHSAEKWPAEMPWDSGARGRNWEPAHDGIRS